MGFKEFKAIFFAPGDTNGTEMQKVSNMTLIRALNAKSNSAEILINNYAGESVQNGEVIYKPDGTIKVYAAEGNIDTTNPAHLVGIYTILNVEVQPVPKQIKLICGDKTFDMLSKVVTESWTGKTAAYIIEQVVQRINQTGNGSTITTHISQTKSDGNAFTAQDYTTVYKTAYEVIAELSQTNSTGDNKPYIFWFDENGEFWWKYMDETPAALEFEHGVNIFDLKVQQQKSDTIAMLIYNAGKDLDDIDYIDFTFNETAPSIKGHIKYQPMLDISKEYRREIMITNSLSDTTSASILTVMTNTQFQTELNRRASNVGDKLINAVGTGLWQATCRITGQIIKPGDYHTVKAPNDGFISTPMRVERVQHTMNKNGWTTKLTLKEDPAKQ